MKLSGENLIGQVKALSTMKRVRIVIILETKDLRTYFSQKFNAAQNFNPATPLSPPNLHK